MTHLFGVRCAALVLALSAGLAHSVTLDRYGRPLDGAGGKRYYDPSDSLQAMRVGTRNFAPQVPRGGVMHGPLQAPKLRPMHGDGGSFGFSPYRAYPIGSWPDAVAIRDIDGDGRNDVVLTTTYYFDADNDYHVFVFLQDPDGSLRAPISFPYPDTANDTGLVVLPGALSTSSASRISSQIVVGTNGGLSRFLWRPDGPSSPQFYIGSNFSVLARMDVDFDQRADVVALPWGDDAEIYFGGALGGFTSSTTLATNNGGWNSMAVADFDNDHRPDLVIASPQASGGHAIDVFWHESSGAFGAPTSVNMGNTIWYAAAGDIDHDGRADIVAGHSANSPTYLFYAHGNGDRTFDSAGALPTYDIPETVLVQDVNGDGRDDIVTVHGGWEEAGVYLQASDGGMGVERLYPIPYASHYGSTALALGDINGDGCTDAVIADYNNGLIMLYGEGCAG
ncbi:MAG TPA: VCBS repeat-containing protein [Rhodanobacteraceae bacterium]|nr:VCBS repeat-containing protein [Rhodanobacteraceae bacterium]